MIYKLLLMFLITGCSHLAPQFKNIKESYTKKNIPSKSKVKKEVPFIKQEQYYCGPSTLAMVMQYYDKDIQPRDISDNMYIAKVKGTFQQDMISSSRRNGMMATPIKDFENLIAEINNDQPIIVFMNLAFDWYPLWHYAVVYGYDLDKEIVYMHSGEEKNKKWDMVKFERSWKRGDYWGLAVFAPDQTSTSSNEHEHIRSAASLENIGKISEAETAYHSIIKRWPESFNAYMGLGNIAFNKNKYDKAKKMYERVLSYKKDHAFAWHNLALTYINLNQKSKARESFEKAIKFANSKYKKVFQKSYQSNLNKI